MQKAAILGVLGAVIAASPALAYVGPGLGLGAVAAVFGVIASAVLALGAIIWYPLKRVLGVKKKRAVTTPEVGDPAAQDG